MYCNRNINKIDIISLKKRMKCFLRALFFNFFYAFKLIIELKIQCCRDHFRYFLYFFINFTCANWIKRIKLL